MSVFKNELVKTIVKLQAKDAILLTDAGVAAFLELLREEDIFIKPAIEWETYEPSRGREKAV